MKSWTRSSPQSERAAISAVLDCSFVVHALFPRQRTPEARKQLASLMRTGDPLAASDGLFLEYLSLLRRSVNKQQITSLEADEANVRFIS